MEFGNGKRFTFQTGFRIELRLVPCDVEYVLSGDLHPGAGEGVGERGVKDRVSVCCY